MQLRKSHALPAVFWSGLVAGALDITAAFVTWAPQGVSPIRILQGIASGLLGAKAFAGGKPQHSASSATSSSPFPPPPYFM